MPSRAASAAISSVLRATAKWLSVMSRVKCLAILCLSSTAATLRLILAVPRSGCRLRATGVGDTGQFRLGGGGQIVAFAGALRRERPVAADDQALARKIG